MDNGGEMAQKKMKTPEHTETLEKLLPNAKQYHLCARGATVHYPVVRR